MRNQSKLSSLWILKMLVWGVLSWVALYLTYLFLKFAWSVLVEISKALFL